MFESPIFYYSSFRKNASIIAYITLWICHIITLYMYNNLLVFIVIFLISWYLADLFSGLKHWYFENRTMPKESEKFMIELVSKQKQNPNKNLETEIILSELPYLCIISMRYLYHHINPNVLSDYRDTDALVIIIGSTPYIFLMVVLSILDFFIHLYKDIFNSVIYISLIILISSAIFVAVGYMTHSIIHRPASKKSFIYRIFQRIGFLMKNHDHFDHHLDARFNYSVINGWANPMGNNIIKMVNYFNKSRTNIYNIFSNNNNINASSIKLYSNIEI